MFVGFGHRFALGFDGAIKQLIDLAIGVSNDVAECVETRVVCLNARVPRSLDHLARSVENALGGPHAGEERFELTFQHVWPVDPKRIDQLERALQLEGDDANRIRMNDAPGASVLFWDCAIRREISLPFPPPLSGAIFQLPQERTQARRRRNRTAEALRAG